MLRGIKKFERLDLLLVQRGLTPSRNKAQGLIGAGKVLVDGRVVDKAGFRVGVESQIEISAREHPYASRGGVKLAHALDHFSVAVQGLVCMDVGCSTGGFTDCLLMNGASLVYAVDVGYGQLDWRLRQDSRVVLFERTNIRHLSPDALKQAVDFVTVDTSFISLRIVLPAILPLVRSGARILSLVKPQFEVGREKVGKGGVVKDPVLHRDVLDTVVRFAQEALGMEVLGSTPSPILGAKGNREFWLYLEAPKTD